MSKRINIDFYHVTVHQSQTPDFAKIVGDVNAKELPDRNWPARDGHVIRMQECRISSRFISGDMIRLRMVDVPQKGSLQGQVTTLGLKADEGVAEETAFFYVRTFQVLALQRNRNGTPPGTLASYFKSFSDASFIELAPILEPAAVRRLAHMVHVRRFDIRLASVVNPAVLGQQRKQYGFNAMNDIIDHFKAPNLSISMSVGRKRKGSLPVEMVKNAAQSLLSMNAERDCDVKQIDIHGRDEDDKPTFVDLLDMRMSESMDVSGHIRNVPFSKRMDMLERAYRIREEDIQVMYEKQ